MVIGVDFRNGGGRRGAHSFPVGLHDCADAVRWIAERREELGVGKIVLSGESGGGNLTLAVALLANREGWIGEIAGVYAQCPYIGGPELHRDPTDDFISLTENDGYGMARTQVQIMAEIYDPNAVHRTDPVCWPSQAKVEDLVGLPPHFIQTDELDPLRDEGIDYYRRLRSAGVSAIGMNLTGIPHAGAVLYATAIPDVADAIVSSIAGFARSL
jgi:acetyl esterase/lipase